MRSANTSSMKKVGVVGEKESLTRLGREELLDERAGKMTVFTR